MGLKKAITRWLLKDYLAELGGSNVSAMTAGRPYYPNINPDSLIERYKSWVYIAIQRNSTTSARVPLRLYSQKKNPLTKSRFRIKNLSSRQRHYLENYASPTVKATMSISPEVVEITEHPLLDLLREVNDFMNQFELKQHCFASLDCTGHAYWEKIREKRLGVPIGLWPLPPGMVKILPDKTKFIRGYEYGYGQQKRFIPPENMIHFKYISLVDNYGSVGPLEACVTGIDLSNAMNRYEVSMFQNDGRPDIALKYPEANTLSDTDRRRIRRDWRRKFSGAQNAGSLIILEGGVDIEPIGISPKEMSFLKGRQWSKEEILAAFGVPTAFVEIQNISRANAHEAKVLYAEQTIMPRLTLVEEKLNEKLVKDFDESLFLAFDDPRPVDAELRLKQIAVRLKNKMTTINEERAIDGMDEVEWGDEPINNAPPSFDNEENNIEEENVESEKSFTQPIIAKPAANYEPTLFIQKLLQFYEKMKLDLLAKVTDEEFRGIKIKTNPDDILAGWWNVGAWNKGLVDVSKPFVRASLLIGGTRGIRKVKPTMNFEPLRPEVQNALEKRMGVIVNANVTTRKRIRKVIAAGIEEGEGARAIRARISKEFIDIEKVQATTIARTETLWAFNEGAVQGYKQSGVVAYKQWWAANDDRTCSYCSSMHGTKIGLDQSFYNKGEVGLMPDGEEFVPSYEDIDHPPLHPNCRCTIVPVLG